MTDLPYVLPIGDDRRAWFIVAGWDELYAHIPPVPCKGLCHESCGPIGLTPAEQARLREAHRNPCSLLVNSGSPVAHRETEGQANASDSGMAGSGRTDRQAPPPGWRLPLFSSGLRGRS
jgi:hypothetical protein